MSYQRALTIANGAQHLHNVTVPPEKLAAKQRGAELLLSRLKPNGQVLDIGGEDFYAQFIPNLTQLNLPNDMHNPFGTDKYDGILAMHVLEHSPAPLVVLLNIHDALKPGGVLYVATPPPTEPFLSMPSHFTVLPKEGWEKLLAHAGFNVVFHETGRFGNYDPAVEDRFLCMA